MDVNRDVIRDLLPVYLSGEASAATCRVVEDAIASDPELSREVGALRADLDRPSAPPAIPRSVELRTLARAKRLYSFRALTFGLGLFFTLLPFSFAYDQTHGLTWWMVRDQPDLGLASLSLGISCWVAYVAIRRKLRVPGL
ncbi:MAG: hypothetical protein U0166_22800 [Acidobacteriota bacterium]